MRLVDEVLGGERMLVLVASRDSELDEPARPKLQRDSGTLFERMSNIARGAGKIEEEAAPTIRREPLDIPRFLNRQNNQ